MKTTQYTWTKLDGSRSTYLTNGEGQTVAEIFYSRIQCRWVATFYNPGGSERSYRFRDITPARRMMEEFAKVTA